MRIASIAAAAFGAASAALAGDETNLAHHDAVRHSAEMEQTNLYTIVGAANLMEMPPRTAQGAINAIVEIPTGTSAKWELDKDNPHAVHWEFRNGKPRIVDYLGYPGNYGSIPGSALPKDLGGDGDPLDVLVLGQAAPRGAVLNVRLIGVLKMLDDGERDDKLIAVMTERSPFSGIESMSQLDAEYPGVSDIVSIWFSHYKGPDGGMVNQGFADVEEALAILDQAIASFAPND